VIPLTREGRAALRRAVPLGALAGVEVAAAGELARLVSPGWAPYALNVAGLVALVWLWWMVAPRPARSSA
jgi:hypothetical protein